MKLKDLKAKLDSMSEEQLEANSIVVGQIAVVGQLASAIQNIGYADRDYYLDEDNPNELIDEHEMNREIQYGLKKKMPSESYLKKGQPLIMI